MTNIKDVLISPQQTSFAQVESMAQRAVAAVNGDSTQLSSEDAQALTATSSGLEAEAAADDKARDAFQAKADSIKVGIFGYFSQAKKDKDAAQKAATGADVESFADRTTALTLQLLREKAAPASDRAMGKRNVDWQAEVAQASKGSSTDIAKVVKALSAELKVDTAFKGSIDGAIEQLQTSKLLDPGWFKNGDEQKRINLFQLMLDQRSVTDEASYEGFTLQSASSALWGAVRNEIAQSDPSFAKVVTTQNAYASIARDLGNVGAFNRDVASHLQAAADACRQRSDLILQYASTAAEMRAVDSLIPSVKMVYDNATVTFQAVEASWNRQNDAVTALQQAVSSAQNDVAAVKTELAQVDADLAAAPADSRPDLVQRKLDLTTDLLAKGNFEGAKEGELRQAQDLLANLANGYNEGKTEYETAKSKYDATVANQSRLHDREHFITCEVPRLRDVVRDDVLAAQSGMINVRQALSIYADSAKPVDMEFGVIQLEASLDAADSFCLGDLAMGYDPMRDIARLSPSIEAVNQLARVAAEEQGKANGRLATVNGQVDAIVRQKYDALLA